MENLSEGVQPMESSTEEEKTEPKKFVITKRHDDFHICLEGHPEIWNSGKSYTEAIGDFILTHEKELGIVIKWNKEDPWTKRYLDGDPLTKQRDY